jgi:Dolichyl-phosphate-mannose-protein mannosyltransferase
MYDNFQIPPPDPESEEPTVLDLFKSIFKDWDSLFNFLSSVFDAARREQINRALAEKQEVIVEPAIEPSTSDVQPPLRFPWRAFLGLGFALLAQRVLEPPGRTVGVGITLYLIAFALILWSYFADKWELPPLSPDHDRHDPETLRLLPLILAAILAFLAFASFSNNLFRVGNVTLWLLSIAFFVYSLWLPYHRVHQERSEEENRRDMLWGLLLLGVTVVIVFFRVYRINMVPPEPFSDHAEKILDVYDVSQGQTHIFFPRNTGREAIQMYWTLLMSWIFGTGLSFISLKIGTVLLGLFTLPYMYLLGKEVGGKRVGLFTLLFTGIGYWPNVISRVGLRFPLYPLFVAPTLYYMIRGLRTRNRNDFILSGLFLGFGLHGYSPTRILPIVVVIAIGLYILHTQSKGVRRDAVLWLVILGLASLVVFTPLLRYSIDNPGIFSYRALSRLGGAEQPLPAPALQIFFSNLWKGLGMFNWDDGEIWVHSVTHRPALGVVSGALFLIGVVLVLVRYLRHRHWLDLFLLLSIPLLAMPSILSLAFPGENPALNRAAGAYVPAFVLVGLALDSLVSATLKIGQGKLRTEFIWGLVVILMVWSGIQNYDLVFHQYYEAFRAGSWNSSEMGAVIKLFGITYGETDTVWIVPFPHWVDTRLPGVWAGIPNRDFAMWRENLPETVQLPGPKLFMVKADLLNPEANDQETLDVLKELYPGGSLEIHRSDVPGHDFWIYSVP